jgi:diguanylate cyclase (GGDEF)-like protein/PAS domain S-box-containing protein
MDLLNMRMVVISFVISNTMCVLISAIIWLQNRKHFAGLGFWLTGALMQFFGLLLIALRGVAPDFLSLTVGNTLLIGGVMVLTTGLRRFLERDASQVFNLILLLAFILVHGYFSYVLPNLQARTLVFSLAFFLAWLPGAWLMLHEASEEMRPITRGIGILFVGFCLVSLVRIAVVLLTPPQNDFLLSNIYDTTLTIIYQMLIILLVFGLVMMVNRRLMLELETASVQSLQMNQALSAHVKELRCIYDLSLLVETPNISLDEILDGSLRLLTLAMQYPHQAWARLSLEDRSYTTDNYRDTARKLSQDITFEGRKIGALEVGYLEDTGEMGAAFFLDEEKSLLLILAERLGKIIRRKQTEAALKESEERFHKAFHSSPDAILISRLDDGKLIEVNEGFCRLTGFTREEALSSSSIDLGLWANQQDRERLTAILRDKRSVREQQFEFRVKSGEIVDGLYSGEIIFLGDEAHVLSVVRDISEQKRVEEAMRQSEQKFRGVIEQSWDGITVTDEQGLITEWNRAMERIIGLQAADVIGKPIWDVQFQVSVQEDKKPERYERTKATITELLESGKAPWLGQLVDSEFRHLNGSRRFVQSVIFPIRSERGFMLCSVVRDVTERKQAEEITRLRLVLWEYAASNPLEKLMQKALDEIGALTGSPIGFYHFVEADQKTLSLQAWSTRTLQEFCQAEGKGLHYDIDEAGVWVEAFHARKPVIHNDYAALPQRKGLPEGHAEVHRELVVPVIRDGRVVSILGVGNKSFAYDENDVELVSSIADIIWTIVEQKRTDERIQQLNTRLEIMAMTDALTGALNRRSFFMRGEEEFKRFLRYQTPFSLLMLDIDGFKIINDTYGHDVGDRALQCFVETLQQNIRKTDLLARLGGEEFGILLANTEAVNARVAASKLRQAIESRMCAIEGDQAVGVTVSIGVATADHRLQSFESCLKNADIALYQAKKQGKNRVVQYRDET